MFEGEFQADCEEEQYDADFGQYFDVMGGGYRAEPMGTSDDTRHEEAHDCGHAQSVTDQEDYTGKAEDDDDIVEKRDGHFVSIFLVGFSRFRFFRTISHYW